MKLILGYIRRHLGMFFTAVLFLSLETLADLLQPAFMSMIVDSGVKAQDGKKILVYGGAMLLTAAVGAAGAVTRNIYATRTSQMISREMRSDIYRKVQTLSFENIDRLQPASIITRITNDVTQIQNFINGSMRILLKAPVTCIGAVALILVQTPEQFPVMCVILLVSSLLIWGNMKLGYPRFGKLQQRLDRLNDVSREFLSSVRVVKAFGAEEEEKRKFREAAEDFAEAGAAAMRVSAVFSPLINLTVNMGIVVILLRFESGNAGEIGRLMASVNYMTQVLFSLGMVSRILNTAVRAAASAGRVEEILGETPAQTDGQEHFFPENGTVEFEDVSFGYAGTSKPALEHISFCIPSGETVGIIGATGSGKSTLVNLVPRFYDAVGGQVKVGGRDVREFSMEELREQIAVVPQKALLFTGTIRENLRWGNPQASEEEILEAARAACAHEFAEQFPMGYDTPLGQNGVNLSGGQKQRLSLARALLKRPEILILDDCTSALDAATEAAVLENLKEQGKGRTVLLISQRISTVRKADRILCLESGKVRGFGRHEELLKNCRAYQDIYESQIGSASGKERKNV